MDNYLPNHTSADDLKSSLKLWIPSSRSEKSDMIAILRESINDEVKDKNRATVIKLLNGKIRSLNNQK